MAKDRTKCTVIYQGTEADIDDKAAVQNLLTPMFQTIHKGAKFMETVKRTLLYKFTPGELKVVAEEMAAQVEALDMVESDKKEANDQFKDKIERHKRLIKEAARKINTGQEQRLIDCTVDKDHVQNVVRVFRLDTHELVEERAMTKEERQLSLVPGYAPEQDGEAAH
jgi:hypothetical protein